MKVLLVGDPHVQIRNLEESHKLFDWIFEKAKGHDKIILLGDLFHTHDVIRAQVMTFWLETLKQAPVPVIALTGNHDMPGSKELEGKVSALDPLKTLPTVTVIDTPAARHGMFFIPYLRSKEDFATALLRACEEGYKIVFCHQTFDGSTFENGFYAPDGFPIDNVPPGLSVISGHIHHGQKFGPVWYPGTPRWLTSSDANSKKGVYSYDTVSKDIVFHDAEEIIEPMIRIQVKEGSEIPQIPDSSRCYVEITGSTKFISSVKKNLPTQVQVSSKPTDSVSRGSKRSFTDLKDFSCQYETKLVKKEEFQDFVKRFWADI